MNAKRDREPDGRIPVDIDHVELADQPSADETIGEPHHGVEIEKGGDDERDVRTRSRHTLGRHITSESGFDVGKRRHNVIVGNRKETEKAFESHRQTHHSAK